MYDSPPTAPTLKQNIPTAAATAPGLFDPAGYLDVQSCLRDCQDALGVHPNADLDAHLYCIDACGPLQPGSTAVTNPDGSSCASFSDCFMVDLPYSLANSPAVLQESANRAGEIVGGALGTAVKAATGSSLTTILVIVAAIGALYVASRVL
jgi:hypothetical protein